MTSTTCRCCGRPHRLLAPRVWELRDNLSAYDASYVALAEALQIPLVTTDARLARAPGIRCEVEVSGRLSGGGCAKRHRREREPEARSAAAGRWLVE